MRTLQLPFSARAGGSWWMPAMALFLGMFLYANGAEAQLSGTYTICSSGCDYSTIKDAANDLNNVGVSGPVTFNIAAGNYQENIQVNDIKGASATNTITFKGAGPGATRVHNSSGTMFYLNYSRYITIQDMTIQSTSTSGTTYGVRSEYAQYCTVKNCRVFMPAYLPNYIAHYPLYHAYSRGMTYEGNTVRGGYYGIYSYDYNYSSSGYHKFIDNHITKFYYYGCYNYQYNTQGQCQVIGNYADSADYASSTAWMDYYDNGCLIRNNRFGMESNCGYGLRLYEPNYYGPNTSITARCYNNFIGGQYNPLYIYMYYSNSSQKTQVSHNTVHSNYGSPNYTVYVYCYYANGSLEMTNNSFTRTSANLDAYYYFYNGSIGKVDGNNFYNTGGTNFSINYNNLVVTDIPSYKALSGEKFVANVNMPFKSATDWHLDQSKIAPFGSFAGITEDYDGDTRCNLFPTSGADESAYGKGKPVPKIFGNSSVIYGTPTVFYNSSKAGEPKIHKWYIDDVFQTDSIHLETTKLTGPTNKIKLVTEGCGGKDSATLTVTVQLPSKTPVSDFIADKNSVKAGGIINFYDLSINGPSQWEWKIKPDSTYDFGMKTPTVKVTYGNLQSPKWQGKFNYPGKYEVCLTTSNLKGKGTTECKSDYIEVIATTNMSQTTIIKEPKGFLYDNGGPNGSPTYNANPYTAVIDPCADSVYLIVKDFALYCGYDYLQIYEGKDKNGKVLHKCTGNTGWNNRDGYTGSNQYACSNDCRPSKTDTFKAKGSMFILLDIYSGVTQPGIELYWWSKPKQQAKPQAKFSSVDTICTNGVVTFTNETVGDEVSYIWDLDGDPSFFEATSKNTNWPYFFPGQYTVTMIAQNCGGVDTFTKTITVLDPPTPSPDFKADNQNPTTNDIVYFTSTTAECVDDYEWVFTKKHGKGTVTYVNGTASSSVAPQVVFPDTGLWHVEFKATNVTGTGTEKKDNYINVKGSYCNPSVSNILADIGISKVVFNEINNSSPQGVDGYENYTPTVATLLEIGVKYPLTVERTSNKNKANRTAWIDWNGDGDFDDAQEHVADENNSSALSWTVDVTVPTFAKLGATKMRVAINQSNYGNKVCGQNEFGEYEDYRLYISPDITPPVITMKGMDTVRLEQGYAYTDSGATAWDNLYGNLTPNIHLSSAPTFNPLIPNTYVFTYTVKDPAGNEAKPKTRVVIITPDVTPPALRVELPETLKVAYGEPYVQPKVISADDLVDGDMTGNLSINDPVNPLVVGTYVVSYTTADLSGNDTTVTRVVEVIDSIAPMMSLIGMDTVLHDVNMPYTDAGVILSDNYYSAADLNANLTTSSNIDIKKLGTYVVNYVLKDPSGNGPVTVQRIVKVVDREAPVLATIDDTVVTVEVFDVYDDPGIKISDNYYTITAWDTAGTFFQEFPDGKTTKLGAYTIIYEVTDGSGNTSTITRTINVVDIIAPVVALTDEPSVTVCRWEDYQDAGYDVSDNYWSNGDVTITMEGTFVTKGGTDMPGFYSFRYKAEDKSGNVAYSDWRYILVLSENDAQCVSGIAGNNLEGKVSIYPNPNSGKFNVTTELPGTDRVRISITNALGQEVAVISNGALGSNTFTVDLSTQANGIYMLKVVSSNYSITRQIIVNK